MTIEAIHDRCVAVSSDETDRSPVENIPPDEVQHLVNETAAP